MWHGHPENQSAEAWQELVTSMAEAVRIAEDHGVVLAFEPEVSNVIDSARRARALLDEIRSPALKVVIDAANLFHTGELAQMDAILDEAFDLLGPDIVLAHAKDLDHDGDAGHLPAGHGRLNYARYGALLQKIGYTSAWVLHGLAETDVAGCVAFLEATQNR
jgi:sugar phosphate isomerase/epimerase